MDTRQRTTEKRIFVFVFVFVVVVLGCAYLSYVYGPKLLTPSTGKEECPVKPGPGSKSGSECPATKEIPGKKNSKDGKGSSDRNGLDKQKPPNKEDPCREDGQKRTVILAQRGYFGRCISVLKCADKVPVDAGSSRKDKDGGSSSKDKETGKGKEKEPGAKPGTDAKPDAKPGTEPDAKPDAPGTKPDTETDKKMDGEGSDKPGVEGDAKPDTPETKPDAPDAKPGTEPDKKTGGEGSDKPGVEGDAKPDTPETKPDAPGTKPGTEPDKKTGGEGSDKPGIEGDKETDKNNEVDKNKKEDGKDPKEDSGSTNIKPNPDINPATNPDNGMDKKTSAETTPKSEENSSGTGLASVDTKERPHRKEQKNTIQFLKEIVIDTMKKEKLIREEETNENPGKISLIHNEETDLVTLVLKPVANPLTEIMNCIESSGVSLHSSIFACIVIQVPFVSSVSKDPVECIFKNHFETAILNNLSCNTLHIKNIESLPRDKDLKNSNQSPNPTANPLKNSSSDSGTADSDGSKKKSKSKTAPTRLILTNVGPNAFDDILASIDISKVEILEITRSSLKKSKTQASGLQFSSLTSLFLSDIDTLEIDALTGFLNSSASLSALGLIGIKASSNMPQSSGYKLLADRFVDISKTVVTLSCDLYKLLLNDKELGFSSKTFTSLILYATEEELASLCASDSSSPKPSDEVLKADNLVVFVWARVKNSSSEALKSHASKIDTEQFAANIQVKALKSFEVLLVGINVGMGERIEERLLDKFVPNIEENASTSTQKLETLKGIWGLDPTALCVLSIYLFSPS
ncbi:hypothetical protein NECID01_1837 [Nematocida sp. AWRm77]|nr:hypothetical protein NECID01_1837 [Nematocida sp. AWRm77]